MVAEKINVVAAGLAATLSKNEECKWKLFSAGGWKYILCLISNFTQGSVDPAGSTTGASSPSLLVSSFLHETRPSHCSFPALSPPCLPACQADGALQYLHLSSACESASLHLLHLSLLPPSRAHREVEITPPSSSFTSVTLPNHVSMKEPVFSLFPFSWGPLMNYSGALSKIHPPVTEE